METPTLEIPVNFPYWKYDPCRRPAWRAEARWRYLSVVRLAHGRPCTMTATCMFIFVSCGSFRWRVAIRTGSTSCPKKCDGSNRRD